MWPRNTAWEKRQDFETRAWPGLAQVSKLPSSSTSTSSRLRRDHTHFPRLQEIMWHFLMATHGRCRPDTGPFLKSTSFLQVRTAVFSEMTLWSGKPGTPSVSEVWPGSVLRCPGEERGTFLTLATQPCPLKAQAPPGENSSPQSLGW